MVSIETYDPVLLRFRIEESIRAWQEHTVITADREQALRRIDHLYRLIPQSSDDPFWRALDQVAVQQTYGEDETEKLLNKISLTCAEAIVAGLTPTYVRKLLDRYDAPTSVLGALETEPAFHDPDGALERKEHRQ